MARSPKVVSRFFVQEEDVSLPLAERQDRLRAETWARPTAFLRLLSAKRVATGQVS
jgi:hypothetical protein